MHETVSVVVGGTAAGQTTNASQPPCCVAAAKEKHKAAAGTLCCFTFMWQRVVCLPEDNTNTTDPGVSLRPAEAGLHPEGDQIGGTLQKHGKFSKTLVFRKHLKSSAFQQVSCRSFRSVVTETGNVWPRFQVDVRIINVSE